MRARERGQLSVIAEEDTTAADEDSADGDSTEEDSTAESEMDFEYAGENTDSDDLDTEDLDLQNVDSKTARTGQESHRPLRTTRSTTTATRRDQSSITTTTTDNGAEESTIVVTSGGKTFYQTRKTITQTDNQFPKTTTEVSPQRFSKVFDSSVRLYRQIQGVSVISTTTDLNSGELYLYTHPIYSLYRVHEPSLLRICWTPVN